MGEPIFTQIAAKPRGPTSSAEYNKLNDDILYDLIRLYESSDQVSEDIERLVNLLIHENIFLRRKLDNLENLVNELTESIVTYPEKKTTILPMNFVTTHPLYAPTKQALMIDNDYRIVTLKPSTNTISRTHLIDSTDGSTLIPKELVVEILPVADGISSTDDKVKEAFDPNSNMYWERKCTYISSSQVDEEECLLIVKLPDNITNNLYANVITLRPFPENSYDIMAVYYNKDVFPKAPKMWQNQDEKDIFHETMLAGGWELIPGFGVDADEQPIVVQEASRTKWCFPDTVVTQLVFRLRQRNWLDKDSNKVFTLGALEIDAKLEIYNKAGGYAIFEFIPSLSAEDGRYTISNIVPHFANNDALSSMGRYNESATTNNCITFDVMVERSGSLVKVAKEGNGYQGLLGSDPCWIIVTLYPDPIYKSTPALDKIEVYYTTS